MIDYDLEILSRKADDEALARSLAPCKGNRE